MLRVPYGAGFPVSRVGSIGICPHWARSLLGDHKLEEPSRELPTGLGIDPRDLSAYHHFLEVNKRILHHRQVAFVLPTPP